MRRGLWTRHALPFPWRDVLLSALVIAAVWFIAVHARLARDEWRAERAELFWWRR